MKDASSVSYSSSPSLPITSLCLGTGRFLRSVLVPALLETDDCNSIVLIQPRGTSFVDYCHGRRTHAATGFFYEVDTIEYSGEITTEEVGPIQNVISMTRDRPLLSDLIQQHATSIRIVGVGVTEAGLASYQTKAMQDLVWIFYQLFQNRKEEYYESICVLNTDNVPFSGNVIQSLVLQAIDNDSVWSGEGMFREFCGTTLVFLNTMVDRITSQRKDSEGIVPLAEPVPEKALVIEDLCNTLPVSFHSDSSSGLRGVVVRSKRDQFQFDLELKLVIANATHTACAHALALSSYLDTTVLSKEANNLFIPYLDSLFQRQILPTISDPVTDKVEAKKVYEEWRCRLLHPYFGLSTFFIGQNGIMKSGIRISPTVRKLLETTSEQDHHPVTAATAFAYASILRYVTPATASSRKTLKDGTIVYRGRLDQSARPSLSEGNAIEPSISTSTDQESDTTLYADNMYVNCREGWYEFKCSCMIQTSKSSEPVNLPDLLASFVRAPPPAIAYSEIIREFLTHSQGGNMPEVPKSSSFHDLISAIATLYARMIAGDTCIDILQEMRQKKGIYSTHGFEAPCSALVDISSSSVSDAHASALTLRPLHFRLCPIPDESRLMQVPIVFKKQSSLIDPVTSEEQLLACIVCAEVASVAVIDVHTHLFPPSHGSLCLFGVDELLTYHYLVSEFFMTAPAGSITPDQFYALNKTEQANIIWNALFLQQTPLSEAARGVITTLTRLGLWSICESNQTCAPPDLNAIRTSEQQIVKELGVEAYCNMIFDIAGVRYAVMTNVPFDPEEAKNWLPNRKPYSDRFRSALRVDDFLKGDKATLQQNLKLAGYEGTLEGARQYLRDWADTYLPEYMMASTPHDFQLVDDCCQTEDDALNVSSDYFSEALMKVCEERDLPIALKIGAHRNMNPSLKAAGDGMVAFADGNVLARLCTRFPKVRFLATFLSRSNQHEACVLASKFRNLHIYGCWWYCNIPSIVQETTQMRLEMLGTAFTAQHSDARVLDHLVYKWSHSRAVVAHSLLQQYAKLLSSGWTSLTRSVIRRDVKRLLGGSYEEFMTKSLV